MLTRAHDRLGWAVLALASASLLIMARLLTPSATGVGTHTQLGLPPCGFLALFHLPCPACGLTTAFAHLAHGDVRASFGAHPLGLPLFAALVVTVPAAVEALVRGRAMEMPKSAGWMAGVYTAGLLIVWMVRLVR